MERVMEGYEGEREGGLVKRKPDNPMAVIAVESAVKYSFVSKGMQTRRKSQYNAVVTLSPCLHAEPLIGAITATHFGDG